MKPTLILAGALALAGCAAPEPRELVVSERAAAVTAAYRAAWRDEATSRVYRAVLAWRAWHREVALRRPSRRHNGRVGYSVAGVGGSSVVTATGADRHRTSSATSARLAPSRKKARACYADCEHAAVSGLAADEGAEDGQQV